MITLTEGISIRVSSRTALDDRLDSAVRKLQEVALQSGTQGILITRLSPGHYTAALSDTVPYGMTRESFL